MLVDAGDRPARWSTGPGLSFPVTRILAHHILAALGAEAKQADEIVLAIPNDLDEYGQDDLIRELLSLMRTRDLGNSRVRLVWRPVAAALAWLEKTQDHFPAQALQPDDLLLVVHVGPDCVEVVPLRLREREFEGRRYIVPLREPPRRPIPLSGCDWAASLAEPTAEPGEVGALWQAFTQFPEIWEALAEKEWDDDALPRAWSLGQRWALWDPNQTLRDRFWHVEARVSTLLSDLACRREERDGDPRGDLTWVEFLKQETEAALEVYGGRLWGVVLSGPLGSSGIPPWLASLEAQMKGRGLKAVRSSEPRVGAIWALSEGDAVPKGALIYGQRVAAKAPSYLDTLPRLEILAERRFQYDWIPLVDAPECEGGETYERSIERQFLLRRDSTSLSVYLRKGSSKTHKKATFQFPYSPDRDMPLSVNVEMSPASGLAKVELIPESKEFLGGRRVFLDYSTMEETSGLPARRIGFPETVDYFRYPIGSGDERILSRRFQRAAERYLQADASAREYGPALGALGRLLKPTYNSLQGTGTSLVDKNGKASTERGQRAIDAVSAKMDTDLQKLLGIPRENEFKISETVQTASWLLGGAPKQVVEYLTEVLLAGNQAMGLVYSAGRCLAEERALAVLFQAASDRFRQVGGLRQELPVHWSRALRYVLEMREGAPRAMTNEQAQLFLRQIVSRMRRELGKIRRAKGQNVFHSFFDAAKLFVYLLRYREKNMSFLSERDEENSEIFAQIIEILDSAKGLFEGKWKRHPNAQKARALIDEIVKYMHFEGTENIVTVLAELAGD